MTLFASDVIDFTAGLGSSVADVVNGAAREAVAAALGKTEKEPALRIFGSGVFANGSARSTRLRPLIAFLLGEHDGKHAIEDGLMGISWGPVKRAAPTWSAASVTLTLNRW